MLPTIWFEGQGVVYVSFKNKFYYLFLFYLLTEKNLRIKNKYIIPAIHMYLNFILTILSIPELFFISSFAWVCIPEEKGCVGNAYPPSVWLVKVKETLAVRHSTIFPNRREPGCHAHGNGQECRTQIPDMHLSWLFIFFSRHALPLQCLAVPKRSLGTGM